MLFQKLQISLVIEHWRNLGVIKLLRKSFGAFIQFSVCSIGAISNLFQAVFDNFCYYFSCVRLCKAGKVLERCFGAFVNGFKTVAGMGKVETSGVLRNPNNLAISGCFWLFPTMFCSILTCAGLIRAVQTQQRVEKMFRSIFQWFQSGCTNVQGSNECFSRQFWHF